MKQTKSRVKISAKSVFDVDHSRLGIGVFSRPLLDHEARTFRRVWGTVAVPDFEDFQVDAKRVSFVAKPEGVAAAWQAIDRVLASATAPIKKAS